MTRLGSLFFASAAALTLASPSFAAAPRAGLSGVLEAAPGTAPVRGEIATRHGAPPAARAVAWDRFLVASGSRSWQALWDADTGAPIRIFGKGIPAPGAVAQPVIAEAAARDLLRAHVALLAPGSSDADFDVVANDLDAGLRTVAFEQRALVDGGARVPVVGGRFSVRFKNDRLFVIASEAAPVARLARPESDAANAGLAAIAWLGGEHPGAVVVGSPELVALPLAGGGRVAVRLAYRVLVEADAPRLRELVYVDARSASPLARQSLLRFAEATVLFDAPVRGPAGERRNYIAPTLSLSVDGVAVLTDGTGAFSFTDSGSPPMVGLDAVGPSVVVSNAAGADVKASFPATDGAQIVWSLATDEYGDAQLSSFTHATLIKGHARGIAPAMPFLDEQLPVRPSEPDAYGCNAFWDGNALNFYRQNATCNNTARVADVVYHEFGHAFHQHAVIPGAGALDPSLGEAAGDTMAASYTHDSNMAPGFFLGSDEPLRQLANTARWPDDISSSDPHETGLIWGGAMWDLRTRLVAELGPEKGHALTDQLYYQALRRSSSIPATYAEILAADDDDGDLENGTPHICAINAAFFAHGLSPTLNEAGLVMTHEPLTVVAPGEGPYPIKVSTTTLYPQCAGATPLDGITVSFGPIGAAPTVETLTPQGSDYVGSIPAQADGTALRYTISALVGGATSSLPDNPADPQYRLFVGRTKIIRCDDFESSIDGWTFGGSLGGKGDFEWGAPKGKGGDPAAAFSGEKVIGDRLNGDGTYKPSKTAYADSPVIDLGGEQHVRLQYRRWLTSEDAYYDKATVYVNGQPVWQNLASGDDSGTLDHVDREWRFEDLDLTSLVQTGATSVQVRFEIVADKKGQHGGWNVDDLCVVAWQPEPPPGHAGGAGEPKAHPVAASGCGCRAVGQGEPRGAAAALLALGVFVARRRRRAAAQTGVSARTPE